MNAPHRVVVSDPGAERSCYTRARTNVSASPARTLFITAFGPSGPRPLDAASRSSTFRANRNSRLARLRGVKPEGMLLLVVNTHETAIDVSCHIPLEAPDDLFLGQPLLGPPVHVVPSSGIEAHPDQDDPPHRVVGDSVPTAVQPVSVRFAGGGRKRCHSAQPGERRFARQTLRVVP